METDVVEASEKDVVEVMITWDSFLWKKFIDLYLKMGISNLEFPLLSVA